MSQARIASPHPDTTGLKRIRVWDLPLRIFHWSLLAAVATAIGTGLIGGDLMPVHSIAGLVIIGLLVFRIVWGVVGSSHSRFRHFAPSPARVVAYLQGRWQGVGHNPLGALSVFGLIGLLALQAGLGLFSNDEISFTGPLAALIDESLSIQLTGWHHRLVNVLYALIGLHVLAIAFYGHVKKEKLIGPMVSGWKDVAQGESTQGGGPLALLTSVAIALGAVWIGNGGLNAWAAARINPDQQTVGVPAEGPSSDDVHSVSQGTTAPPASGGAQPGIAASSAAPAW